MPITLAVQVGSVWFNITSCESLAIALGLIRGDVQVVTVAETNETNQGAVL